MKTAKITEIGKFRKWEGPHGDVFYIPLTLDNGENISLGKKTSDAFKVGDTISYEVVEEGKKWKEVKENNFKKSYNSESNNKSATLGMAIKVAFECMYDKKEQNYKETMALAYRIYEDALEMLNGTKEEKSESKEDEVDLPF